MLLEPDLHEGNLLHQLVHGEIEAEIRLPIARLGNRVPQKRAFGA